MLAIIKESKGSEYKVKDVNIPELRKGDVLIKVKSVGICGTDLSILKGLRNVRYPLIPGHEFAGDIVEIAEGVTEFEIGDRVTPSIVIGCGSCYYCREGIEVLCENLEETGIHIDGAFAEYVRIPAKVLHKLPNTMTYEVGASIDPIASAYRPIKKARITSKDIVLIYGPGPIGLYTVQLAKCEGAKRIIVVGVKGDEERLRLAKELGASHIINTSREDIISKVIEYTEGKLADVVMEVTGNEKVFASCLETVRPAGKILLVGINHAPTTADIEKIVRKEIRVEGSICYSFVDYRECLELVAEGKVKTEPLISHRFKLEEIKIAMKEIEGKNTIKVMLEV